MLARHLYSGLLGRKLRPGSPILLLSLPRGIKAAYSLRSSVSIVPANIFTEPEVNNCFSIIFKGKWEKPVENLAKHEKEMSLSLAIMSKNPIITACAVIIMENCYNHLRKLH